MNNMQRRPSKYSGTHARTCRVALLTYLLPFVVLMWVFSASNQAGIWGGIQVAAAASPTVKQTPAEWYGSEYRQCTHQTTVGLAACIGQLTSAWERRLAEAYQAVSSGLATAGQREALLKAQRLWLKYREANCGYYGAGRGSLSRIEVAECMRVMTKSRARELMQSAGE